MKYEKCLYQIKKKTLTYFSSNQWKECLASPKVPGSPACEHSVWMSSYCTKEIFTATGEKAKWPTLNLIFSQKRTSILWIPHWGMLWKRE